MAQLGQLEVKVEQAGIRLLNTAGEIIDHITWDQVKHLLMPALRHHAPDDPGAPAPAADVAQAPPAAFTTIPTDVLDELKTLFGSWFQTQVDGIRAEVGAELDKLHARIDALGSDVSDDQGVTSPGAPAKKAAAPRAKKTAAPQAAPK
jgi:hypothetical protein